MSWLARAYRANRRRYPKLISAVPGLVAGICAGAAGIGYVLWTSAASDEDMKQVGLVYLLLLPLAGALDEAICRRQYPHLLAHLARGEPRDPRLLLAEVVRLPYTSALRILGVNAGMLLFVTGASLVLIDSLADSIHVLIGYTVAIFVHVITGYLAAHAVARPLHDEFRAAELPEDALGTGRLRAKLLYLYGGVCAIPFAVAVGVLLRDGSEHAVAVGAVGVAAVAVALALSSWLNGTISQPIRTMAERMRRVGGGDYQARLDVFADDDIGLLANAYNRMIDELAASHDELQRKNQELRRWSETLEQRVAERGRELEETKRIALHNEKLAALGTLLSGVGHELNNPLSQIVRNAGNLERDFGPLVETLGGARALLEQARAGAGAAADPGALGGWLDRVAGMKLERRVPLMTEALRNIARGGERSLALVRSLNVFARSSSDPPRPLALRALVDEAVNLLRTDPVAQATAFDNQIPEGLQATVFETPMLQVLLNLARNACQAMEGGGTVTFTARLDDAYVALTVADTGPGIPPEVLPKIFTPFFTTRGPGQGTGLGLAIVQSILSEMHSGEVRAANRTDGGGAVFELRVPRNLEALYQRAVAAQATAATAGAAG